ncbi:unnamed protein product [Penicillium salamii]|uniref:Uncharacterized protein n=1 Tax=Penicillium salamii TaxID=1612424 RepID=A0A9W4MYQ5_9EURO|nr:unnamed protein product [Penicillium salamii]CAG8361042.1 unnamed protein product [Penicillium salamii]CAG8362624.1 unnamed protein product [Penicillium salamii]CAG8369127.1 unnamed protein product [Penicillium salamii]
MTRPLVEVRSPLGSSSEREIKRLQQKIREKDDIIFHQEKDLVAFSKTIKDLQMDDGKLNEIDNRWKEFQLFMQAAMDTKLGIETRCLIHKNQAIENVLKKTRNDLADSREKQSQAIRDLQASAFHLEDPQQWSSDTDNEIRQQLGGLEKRAKAWCRANCVKRLSLQGELPANPPRGWEAVLRYNANVFAQYDQHLPQIILQALLMHCIYGEIFAKPLFFLPWRVQGAGGAEGGEAGTEMIARQDLSEVMVGIIHEITRGNLAEGNSWRCNLLRSLDPKPTGNEPELRVLEATKNRTEMAREAAANSLMEAFLKNSATLPISSSASERTAVGELRQIFVTAAHLSYRLWLRKSYLEVQTMEKIPANYNRQNLELLRAHSLHTAFLEKDEAGLNDCLIRVVVHPALIVHGSSDGTNYEKTRVWKEAVVWMG